MPGSSADAGRGSAEILLVEDNRTDAELALYALSRRHPVDRVEVVRDGAQALDYLFCTGEFTSRSAQALPRVIVLDLKLPKVTGLEVLRRVKSDPRTSGIPVVVLTSSQEDRDVTESYELGANSYVVKPVDFGRFGEAIRELCLYWLLLNRTPA